MADAIGGTANPFDQELDEYGFRKDASQAQRPISWPYDGPRNVTLTGVHAEAHETFADVYTDLGKRVEDFTEANAYRDGDIPLPVGWSIEPQVNLVLSMLVEDESIPVPEYPATITLGNTKTVEFSDDGSQFRFVNAKGPRLVSAQSTLMALFRAFGGNPPLAPQVVSAVNAVADDPERWYNCSMFEGLTLEWDSVDVAINNNKPKARAWPVGPASTGGSTTTATTATTPARTATAEGLTIEQAAEQAAGDAAAFKDLAVKSRFFNNAKLMAAILGDPQDVMTKVLAGESVESITA